MEEVRKTICPTDTGCEAQARVPPELHQTREVCICILKRRAKEARISKTLPHRTVTGMLNVDKDVAHVDNR